MTTKRRELTPEQINENWEKFRALCKRLGDRTEAIDEMLDQIEERFAMAPASSRLEHHNCFAGGLVEHSLRVCQNALKVAQNFFPEQNIPKESIVLVSLMHDLGKIGDETTDYYLPQTSEWHRDKLGELYQSNKELQYQTIAHRSIYLLQSYGVKLSKDEWIAILVHDGPFLDENKPYSMKEPPLATIVSVADLLATKQEKLL